MKTLFAMICVAACFSMPMSAQEKKPTTEDLVKAAKTDKAKRKTSSAKVITNKDVKKAKGKLVVLPPKPDVPPVKTDSVGPIARQDAQIRARKDAEARVDAAQKSVDKLQKELDTIEQQYYEENDPNYRDQVITQRFAQGKQQLDGARRELADARDALNKLEPQR